MPTLKYLREGEAEPVSETPTLGAILSEWFARMKTTEGTIFTLQATTPGGNECIKGIDDYDIGIILAALTGTLTVEFDANVDRLKACEHIAEGDPGWEGLRNECPSTAAVAKLRDHDAALRVALLDIASGNLERITDAMLSSKEAMQTAIAEYSQRRAREALAI